MSEIKNGTLGLYCTEHLKCNHRMTLVFKGLKLSICNILAPQDDTGLKGLKLSICNIFAISTALSLIINHYETFTVKIGIFSHLGIPAVFKLRALSVTHSQPCHPSFFCYMTTFHWFQTVLKTYYFQLAHGVLTSYVRASESDHSEIWRFINMYVD